MLLEIKKKKKEKKEVKKVTLAICTLLDITLYKLLLKQCIPGHAPKQCHIRRSTLCSCSCCVPMDFNGTTYMWMHQQLCISMQGKTGMLFGTPHLNEALRNILLNLFIFPQIKLHRGQPNCVPEYLSIPE